MEVTEEQLEALAPYTAGAEADERGEVDMFCPLHPDRKKSASVNIYKGAWFCHGGCGGGSVRHLMDSIDSWLGMDERDISEEEIRRTAFSAAPQELDEEEMWRWHHKLMESRHGLNWLREVRGIEVMTVSRARLGWDGKRFKIPVFGPEGQLWNIRTYDPDPGPRRKIWGVRGHNEPQLFPRRIIDKVEKGGTVIVCEGEWDALLTLQTGYMAITRTGSAKVWNPEWSPLFKDKRVFLCHDADRMGMEGNRIVGEALRPLARAVYTVTLPFRHREKHGKDLTDFLLDQKDPGVGLARLLRKAVDDQD